MRRISISVLGATVGVLLLLAGPALAQYPPGTVIDAGTHAIGETFTVNLTGFTAGATVTVTVNGTATGTKTATGGSVPVTVTVLSATQLSIDDPVLVSNVCAPNQNRIRGTQTTGGIVREAVFTVNCAGSGVGVPFGQGVGQQQQQQQQQQQLVVNQPGQSPVATPSGGRVAFTGGNLLKWALVATVLVALGAWMLTLFRRHRASPAEGR